MNRRGIFRLLSAAVATPFLSGCSILLSNVFGAVSYNGIFYRNVYNLMPPVEDAYATLKRTPDYLSRIANLLTQLHRHGYAGDIGAFLLHRHFRVEVQTILLEQPLLTSEAGIVHVTAPTIVRSGRTEFWPSRFLFQRRGFRTHLIPLEYSTDSEVRSIWGRFSGDQAAIKHAYEALSEVNLADSIGLSIARRANTDELRIALERTITFPPESVVYHVLPGEEGEDSIPTLWTSRDASGCCTEQFRCKAYCFKAGDGPHEKHHTQIKTGHLGCV